MMLKWFWIVIGSLSVLAGLVVVWSPLPLGLPLFMIGIPLLMRYSPHSRNRLFRLADRYPRLFTPLRRVLPLDNRPIDSSSNRDGNPPNS